jgi:hypothetical protein
VNSGKKMDATFSTEYLPALAAIAMDPGMAPFGGNIYRGIQIEPCGGSGVLKVATNGVVLAWHNDTTGKTSDAMVIDVCERFKSACAEPKVDRPFDCNGDEYDIPLPDWMVPHRVFVLSDAEGLPASCNQVAPASTAFCMVLVESKGMPERMKEECEDMGACIARFSGRIFGQTQTVNRKILKWGDGLPTGEPFEIAQLHLSPWAIRLLLGFNRTMKLRFFGESKPILVDFHGDPNLHAAIMPCDPSKFQEDDSKEVG